MPPSHHRLLYKLDGQERFLIWFSNDRDGVVVRDGHVLSFSSHGALRGFAVQTGLALAEEPDGLHDLDWVQKWVSSPRADTIDCAAALVAWNLFGDVSLSLAGAGAAFLELDRAHDGLYDKLFAGNNLPAVTPPGEPSTPTWSDDEVTTLAAILAHGLALFRRVRVDFAA